MEAESLASWLSVCRESLVTQRFDHREKSHLLEPRARLGWHLIAPRFYDRLWRLASRRRPLASEHIRG